MRAPSSIVNRSPLASLVLAEKERLANMKFQIQKLGMEVVGLERNILMLEKTLKQER